MTHVKTKQEILASVALRRKEFDTSWINRRAKFTLDDVGTRQSPSKINASQIGVQYTDVLSALISVNADLERLQPEEFVLIFPGVQTKELRHMKQDWLTLERMWVYLGCISYHGHRWQRIREWIMHAGPVNRAHAQYLIDLIRKFNTQVP